MVRYCIILLFLCSLISINAQTVCPNQYMLTVVDKAPCFQGDLLKFIQSRIVYPRKALEDSIEGTVFVAFWIDSIGNTKNHSIIKGKNELLNNEALRVAQGISFSKPAMQCGRPVEVRFVVPVVFKISN